MLETTYVENFKSNEDVIASYEAPKDALDGATVYLAWYGYGSYCGSSLVVFEKDGQLFEVNGSQCSCMGLEGQWKPEKTTWAALAMRNFDDGCDGAGEANKILAELVAKHLVKKEG